MHFAPQKILTLAQQEIGLRMSYPKGETSIRRGILTWRDWIRPMAVSQNYLLELEYKIKERPSILVLEPDLHALAGGRRIEHLYSQEKQELCVYYPNGIEWNGTKPLARTVVLWAHEWLVHFEAWLFTGQWDGGGVHPKPKHD